MTIKIHIEDFNLHSDADDSDSDSKLEDLVLHSVGQDSVLNSEGVEATTTLVYMLSIFHIMQLP